MRDFLLGIGFVAVFEGLAMVFLPQRLEELVKVIVGMNRDLRQMIGLLVITVGIGLVWYARNQV